MLILEEADLSPRICKGNILRMHTDKNEVTLVEISNETTLRFYGFTEKAMGDRPVGILFKFVYQFMSSATILATVD